MKNTFKYYAGMLLIGVTLANISCSSDEDGITPAEITNLTAESTSGRIVLRWDTPEDAGIRYIEVNYYDPLQKKVPVLPSSRLAIGPSVGSCAFVLKSAAVKAICVLTKVGNAGSETFEIV